MKNSKNKFLEQLKKPRGWLCATFYVITVLFCILAIYCAVVGTKNLFLQICSYTVYALAAITLGYSVYTIVIYAPAMKERIVKFIKKYALGRKILERYDFRTIIFATVSLIINIAYVGLNATLAIISRSFWYAFLALYYALLVALRSGIVLYHRKKSKTGFSDAFIQEKTEINKYRICGIMLTVIPFTLSVPILQIIFLDRAFVYRGWTVIAFAAYAFYKIIMAIVNLVKEKKQTDLTIQAIRNVALADALVSIFALQTALLYAFSTEIDYTLANVLTGSAVCVLTITLGIIMILKANKQIKLLKKDKKQ